MKQTMLIVGLGLIGGSLALALKGFEDFEIVGVDVSQPTLRYAAEHGVGDRVTEDAAAELPQADVVALALHPQGIVDFLARYRDAFKPGALVWDVCGVKTAILEAAQFGKPCIGPDHGGFTEIIGKGESAIGRLFEPNNLNDLEKQVLTLWNQPVLTEELGRKAYEKLWKEYSSEVVYRKWDELFTKILYG